MKNVMMTLGLLISVLLTGNAWADYSCGKSYGEEMYSSWRIKAKYLTKQACEVAVMRLVDEQSIWLDFVSDGKGGGTIATSNFAFSPRLSADSALYFSPFGSTGVEDIGEGGIMLDFNPSWATRHWDFAHGIVLGGGVLWVYGADYQGADEIIVSKPVGLVKGGYRINWAPHRYHLEFGADVLMAPQNQTFGGSAYFGYGPKSHYHHVPFSFTGGVNVGYMPVGIELDGQKVAYPFVAFYLRGFWIMRN